MSSLIFNEKRVMYMKEALKFSFPKTVPIMAGYLFLGASFGILAISQGLTPLITSLMSLFIYAGSMQFAAVNVLQASFNPIGAFILTLMVNARHAFYGITMLKPYSQMDWKKIYAIFGLTDETFSLTASLEIPDSIDKNWVYFLITGLNQFYWVAGTLIGIFLSNLITFSTEGIEFVLTALFVTIFVEQWLSTDDHTSALVGLASATLSLVLFGTENFLIPAMIGIIGFFLMQYLKVGVKSYDT